MTREVALPAASEAILSLLGTPEPEGTDPRRRPPIVLIDGRSGAGKSVLAALLVRAWAAPVELIRLDDLYPGWGGLRAGSEHVTEFVLSARAAGRAARWQRWDWARNAPAEWHEVGSRSAVVVEGCGVLTAANRRLADLGVWVETPDGVRKSRALARDGSAYEPFWDTWAAQEEAFIHAEDPRSLADVIVHGDR